MSWGAVAGAAIVTVGGLVAGNQEKQAAKGAANAQKSASKNALAEEQRQFDIQMEEYRRKQAILEQQQAQVQTMLAPYMQAGQGALYEMMALSGLQAPAPVVPPGFMDRTDPQGPVVTQPTQEQKEKYGLPDDYEAGRVVSYGGINQPIKARIQSEAQGMKKITPESEDVNSSKKMVFMLKI